MVRKFHEDITTKGTLMVNVVGGKRKRGFMDKI